VDESTIAAIVIGCIVVALAALSSYMAARDQEQEQQRRKMQARKVRRFDRRPAGLTRKGG